MTNVCLHCETALIIYEGLNHKMFYRHHYRNFKWCTSNEWTFLQDFLVITRKSRWNNSLEPDRQWCYQHVEIFNTSWKRYVTRKLMISVVVSPSIYQNFRTKTHCFSTVKFHISDLINDQYHNCSDKQVE